MSSWWRIWCMIFWILLHTVSHTTLSTVHSNEDDFAFDTGEEAQISVSYKESGECPVKRLWGVPDMPAYIGHVFKLQIPKEAFSGSIYSYKASGFEGPLPKWIVLEKHKGLLYGVPEAKDYGEHRLIIAAIPFTNSSEQCPLATDVFTIEVKDKKDIHPPILDVIEQCHSKEDEIQLKIIIDLPIHYITPRQKVSAIENLANFMALDYNAFSILPQDVLEENSKHFQILSGQINKNIESQATTEIQLTVGCSGKLWHRHSLLVHQIKEQVKDGTISFVTRLPVVAWQVTTNKHPVLIRKERQIEGSADDNIYGDDDIGDDDESYSGYDDYTPEEEVEVDLDSTSIPPLLPPPTVFPEPPHHHRHHHGETPLTSSPEIYKPIIEDNTTPKPITINTDNITSTSDFYTTVSHVFQSTNSSITTIANVPEVTFSTEVIILNDTSQVETETNNFLSSPPHTTDLTSTAGTAASTTVEVSTYESSVTFVPSPATQSTEDIETTFYATTTNINIVQNPVTKSTLSTISSEETTSKIIDDVFASSTINNVSEALIPIHRQRGVELYENTDSDYYPSSWMPSVDSESNDNITTSPKYVFDTMQPTIKDSFPLEITTIGSASTVMGKTTEIIEIKNYPPQIQHRMKKVPVTAGKAFSYIIPENLFIDIEDGTNLRFAMYDIEHNPLKSTSWVQFNPQEREVYGLPLEDHVSKWEYIIEATDSKGASVNDTLDITVQQHKGRRTVNHEFSMKLRLAKKYPSVVDWQIRVLKGLVNLFRDTDMDQITVRNVILNSDPVEFIWTNDTLPKNDCPMNDIDRLMRILQTSSEGDPSSALQSAMSPEINVKSVTWRGTGSCQGPPSTPIAPQIPSHNDNFSPMPRNQIDQLKAYVGELFIFKVPEDTFYDHEDGNARNLKMSLTKGDRSPIPSHNWLQFDTKNQEFYGIPLEKDKGMREYQLVCEDRGGLTASDGLIVEVKSGPVVNPPLEFRMTIDTPYDTFVRSALAKRKFVENLYTLFEDKSYNSIKIKSITDKPTIVSWYNISLPGDKCPTSEIDQLKRVLTDGSSLTERVHIIMGTEFPVMSASFVPIGTCAIGTPIMPVPDVPNTPVVNEDASKTIRSDDYIITFIVPIIVIVCMLLISALIACILYRRRRSGKMSVGDDEERQAFRSKGIPVIFQDELDEKPDPTNKSPIIMKEEKPPLLPPPEYKGTDSSSPTPSHTPYHPPPPFTASRDNVRNNRPKPTPSYRKPPPYVPP